jgi:anthranilate synthase/aminodeoxychorismate synthase-like glutamine amidotransferase
VVARPPDGCAVVVVDHHDSYTWNLVHLVAGVTGVVPAVVESDAASAADLTRFTHVVLSPGPGHPDEYDWSMLALGLPVLGVCLGMQGIVTTYGGRVDRVAPAHGEVASVRHDGRGVFTGLPEPLDAVRYHSLAAVSLPSELVATAWAGDVVMGVRHRSLPVEGVQFHPESILSEHGAAMVASFLAGAR